VRRAAGAGEGQIGNPIAGLEHARHGGGCSTRTGTVRRVLLAMSRSDVVRRLRALASRGVPISVRYLLPVHADLVGQALAIFGSFDRARTIAGLAAPPL